MSKERELKRKLKSCYRIIENAQKDSEKYTLNGIFRMLDDLYEAKKKIVEIEKDLSPFSRPHPLLGFFIGIDAGSSKELEELGIQSNKQILDSVVANEILNRIINYNKGAFQNFDEHLEFFLMQKDPERLKSKRKEKKSFFDFLRGNKNSQIEDENEDKNGKYTLKNILEEKFELNKEKLKNYFNNFVEHYYAALTTNLKKLSGELNELTLLEEFDFLKKILDKLKEIGLEKKVYVKEGTKERYLEDKEILDMAISYAEKELSFIEKNIFLINDYNFEKFFFQDEVQEHYDFLKDFVKEHNDGSYVNLVERINKIGEIVEVKKKDFSEKLGKVQDGLEKRALEEATKGNSYYKSVLNEFIGLSIKYSKVLEEDDKEIGILPNLYDPDVHISVNNKNQGGVLPLYGLYKNSGEGSLVRTVLDIELNYIRNKNKTHDN
ncbi:MAG: hypothetical protein ACPLXC_00105 [Candidatus Pacearchaeota archaeon]